jgi:maltose O-acetyltransferase
MTEKTEKQKMLAGEEYFPSNKQLQADRMNAKTI